MSRRRDVPCARCGQLIWRGGRTCKPCTQAPCGTASAYQRGCRCADCKVAKAADMRQWQAEHKARTGADYRRQYDKPRPHREYTEAHRRKDAARRARKAGAKVESFAHAEVYERDGWICGICSEAVDKELIYPDPLSPSLDHIKPLVHGGEHSRANTRLAHLACNVRRGAALDEVAA